MNRFLYEKSVSYQGYLIIPFVFSLVGGETIYSYNLLSEYGYKNPFHKFPNPADLYVTTLDGIINIAKEHLDENVMQSSDIDYFYDRYTYNDNLIILHQEKGIYFYDHYGPYELRNIAAPKIFVSAYDCLSWVKQGLDYNRVR